MKTYYVDGEFVSSKNAVIPVTDLSILRGFAVCDIMKTSGKKPYLIHDHINRLCQSAKKIGIPIIWTIDEIIALVNETLNQNELKDEANIRIIITGGSSPDFFHPTGSPRLIILITDMEKLPDHWYKKGVKVMTYPLERSLPEAKITSYVPAAMALKKAKKENAAEALFINRQGQILECTTSNIFAFINSVLVTPKEGVLNGITRQAVLRLSKAEFKIEQRALSLNELLTAQEVFITGTNKGVVPVNQIDSTQIGNGLPGENTHRIMDLLNEDSIK